MRVALRVLRTPSLLRAPARRRLTACSASTMATTPAKRTLDEEHPVKTIGTHDGSFHCDEALGVGMLRLLPAWSSAKVVRTRDAALLAACDLVLDVGGVYDPATNRFDHHQREFGDVFGHGFGTRLSSAGLVYKHFGRDVVASLLGLPPDDATVAAVYLRVYKTFMEAVDGGDNGVDRFAGPARYESHTDLASRVGRLNGAWNEPFDGASQDARFARASTLAVDELAGEVRCAASVWLPGRAPVAAALAPPARAAAHPSGLVLRLASFCPWKEHLFDLEEEDKVDPKPLFVLFPDEASATWRVSTVPSAPGSFGMRRPLPAAWRGLRDGELAAASGVPGAVFVHATGFIGGAKTEQGARDMAAAALALEPDA